MLLQNIIPGNYYIVKSPPTTSGNGAMFQVFRNYGGDSSSPFTVTAARYKISADEIFPLKEEKDIKLAAWFKELWPTK